MLIPASQVGASITIRSRALVHWFSFLQHFGMNGTRTHTAALNSPSSVPSRLCNLGGSLRPLNVFKGLTFSRGFYEHTH